MDAKTLGLVGGVLVLLGAATAVVRVLRTRVDSGLDPAIIETLRQRVNAWWILLAALSAALLLGQTVTIILFGAISFWALREFITLTPTRPGDHRALFWVFFAFTPLQFVLVGLLAYGEKAIVLFSVVIPVYAFLFVPARIAMAGDYKRFLERTAKIQAGLLICVYCLSYAPALLTLKQPGDDGGGGVRLLFFFVLIVQLSDALQYAWSRIPGKHVIVPTISPVRTWEGLLGGTGSVTLIGRDSLVGDSVPLLAGGTTVDGDRPDGLRRWYNHVGHQARPGRKGLRHAGRRAQRRAGPNRLALLRRPGLLPLRPVLPRPHRRDNGGWLSG